MKIAIVAGGTLGHIKPGLILANELSKKHDVVFITSKKDKRFSILNKCVFIKNIYYVDAEGIKKKIKDNIKMIIKDIKAMKEIKKIIKEEEINMVIGMGGYISGLAIMSTNKKIKKIIHEQNKIMGFANKIVLKKVDKILLSFDSNIKDIYKRKSFIVSNPCLFVPSTKVAKEKTNILITSGSNGALELNDLAIKLINNNLLSNYHINLITGEKYYEEVKQKIKNKDNVDIYPFVEDLENYIAKASIIISRAGSSTIFESLSANTIPLLLPSKNVSNNHQYYNANEIVINGMGEIITADDVMKKIKKVNNHYNEYIANIKRYKKKYNLEKMIKIIEEELTSTI